MGSCGYTGRSVSTRKEPIIYLCPCGERFRAEVYRALDAADEREVQRLTAGTLNHVACPACARTADVQVSVLYHDGARERLVLVLPESLRHRELAERARLFTELAADVAVPPGYLFSPLVTFGGAALTKLLGAAAAAGPAPMPAAPERPAESIRPETPPSAVEHPSLAVMPSLQEDEPSQAFVAPLPTAPLVVAAAGERSADPRALNVPNPHSAVTQRWIAGREAPAAFLVEESVLVCAALPVPLIQSFQAGAIELRVQLHRLPSYPLLALTLLSCDAGAKAGGARADEQRALTIGLDIARAAHRAVLELLGRRTALSLELYDPQYKLAGTFALAAPLEENVRRLYREAKDALERLAPSARSFERARGQLLGAGHDRLGRTPVELPLAGDPLETPRQVRLAVAEVARWSEPSAEAYLVEIRALPLGEWRALRERVVGRALELGIAVQRPLVEQVKEAAGAAAPAWPELIGEALRRFSALCANPQANDLSPAEEADNWRLLLRECEIAGVVVSDAIVRQAEAAEGRIADRREALERLAHASTEELLLALDTPELKKQAALLLSARGDTAVLPALFAALPRMSRSEANAILPALVRFGAAATPWLIEGLGAKRSYLRQGCALALGQLPTSASLDALCRQLVAEPTEVWSEVARAFGEAGPAAVAPLGALLAKVDLEGRERVTEALAHIVARAPVAARALEELVATRREPTVTEAVERALARSAAVRTEELGNEVAKEGGEETVTRSFSRRFYEALRDSAAAATRAEPLAASDHYGAEFEGDERATLKTVPLVLARTVLPGGRG